MSFGRRSAQGITLPSLPIPVLQAIATHHDLLGAEVYRRVHVEDFGSWGTLSQACALSFGYVDEGRSEGHVKVSREDDV